MNESMNTVLLQCENLVIGYKQDKRSDAVGLVTPVNFELKAGEVIALLGENGSGKSTFLKTLCGLLQPVSGTVLLQGKSQWTARERAKFITLVRMGGIVCDRMTVREFVGLGRMPYAGLFDGRSQEDERFVNESLALLEVEKFKDRWLTEFRKYLPQGKPLRVLDIGTGTGFFACILAEQGHDATGIDLTPDMVEHAEHMAAVLGLDASFLVMDAENPQFAPESFDVLVTRNLTWTLPHIAKAYREWYQLLKPGGVLINFDADYCAALEDEDEIELPENHAHKLVPEDLTKENEAITMELSAYQGPRPQWDVQLLVEAGFERICVDMGVYRRIYAEIDEFYNPTPIFTIAAYK